MYGILKIGGEDYKVEYSFEAALYKDCVGTVMEVMTLLTGNNDKDVILGLSDLPTSTVKILYAGLLEHHGIEGDGKVTSLADAKRLTKQWILEQGEDGSFYDLLLKLTEQMGEDGFFKRIGLDKIFMTEEEEEEIMPKPTVTPQDHKPKQRKKTTAK